MTSGALCQLSWMKTRIRRTSTNSRKPLTCPAAPRVPQAPAQAAVLHSFKLQYGSSARRQAALLGQRMPLKALHPWALFGPFPLLAELRVPRRALHPVRLLPEVPWKPHQPKVAAQGGSRAETTAARAADDQGDTPGQDRRLIRLAELLEAGTLTWDVKFIQASVLTNCSRHSSVSSLLASSNQHWPLLSCIVLPGIGCRSSQTGTSVRLSLTSPSSQMVRSTHRPVRPHGRLLPPADAAPGRFTSHMLPTFCGNPRIPVTWETPLWTLTRLS